MHWMTCVAPASEPMCITAGDRSFEAGVVWVRTLLWQRACAARPEHRCGPILHRDTLLCCRQAADAPAAGAADAADARQEEARWRRWVDERFVRLITVNIYRSATESFQMFEYIADTGALFYITCCAARAHMPRKAAHVHTVVIYSARVRATCLALFMQPPVAAGRRRQSGQAVCAGRFNLVEREATRVAGALLMWGISGRMRKKYGITGDVREELFAAADEWVAALGSRRSALFHLSAATPTAANKSAVLACCAEARPHWRFTENTVAVTVVPGPDRLSGTGPQLLGRRCAQPGGPRGVRGHPQRHVHGHVQRADALHRHRPVVCAHDGRGRPVLAPVRQLGHARAWSSEASAAGFPKGWCRKAEARFRA